MQFPGDLFRVIDHIVPYDDEFDDNKPKVWITPYEAEATYTPYDIFLYVGRERIKHEWIYVFLTNRSDCILKISGAEFPSIMHKI